MYPDSKKYTGINYVYKLKKLLETDYKMTREQFRTVTELTPNGFVTYLNLTVNALPNQFKGVRGIGPTEQHALNEACKIAYNGLILFHKQTKFKKTGSTGINSNTDIFDSLKGVLERVRKDTGLEDMKNVPKYESSGKGGFIASLKNDPLCPDFLNDFAFTGEGETKKEARIHAESKLLCFLIEEDSSKIKDFLNTKNGMITQKKVWKFLKETKKVGSEQTFNYRPTLQPAVSENLNCRKRKASPYNNKAPSRDEYIIIPNSNPDQKENINYNQNSFEEISSPASKKFHKTCKHMAELQNLEDELPDYDEMEDESGSDNSVQILETISLSESCPDTTLLPLTDEEDNDLMQETSKITTRTTTPTNMESSNITELESSSQESIIYKPKLRPSEIGGFKVVIDEDIKINSKRNMMGVEHLEPVLEKRQKIEIPYSDSSEFIPDTPPIRLSPERDLPSPAFFSEVFSPKIEKIDLTKPMRSEAKIQKNETHKLETSVIETPVIEATKLEVETHIESSKTLKTYDFLVNKTRAMDKTKNISSNYVWTGTEIASGTFGRVYKIDLNPTNESDIVYENGRDLKIKIPKSQVVIKRVDGRHKNHVNDAELEAKYMRLLQSHQFRNFGNSECYQYSHFVAQMIDSFYHQDYQNSTQDYLILMPLYSGDNLLQKYIKQGERPTMKSALNISYQLIAGLAFIESGGFIHADLKPENVQFEKQGSDKLRIIDFGSAENSTDISKTRDVCTDMYRPPEVVLRCSTSSHEKHPFYSTNVDVWSAGCIIFELLHGRVLTDIDSDVDYDRFNRIADRKSKHFWDGFEIDCPGIDRYLMIFRQEYCYFLSRISEINPECPGFISEVVIAGNEEWEVVAKGEYQAHLVEHTDNKYKWYEFASFMKSRGGTNDNGNTYQVKLAKWSFKFPKTWFSDKDISDENRGKLVFRVDYELYEDRDLRPSYTIPENLENEEQRSIKIEKIDTDSDPKTRLEQRYKKLAETMMKMLIISPYKRSSASKLIKNEFDPTDYLNFIELPESAPPSARNSQERSAFPSKFRNSHKRDENYVNSGNRFDRFRSPSFTNSAERSSRERSGREISSSSINHSLNFNRNRSNVLSAKHFQTDRYNNHSNGRKISNYQGGNNYQSSNNYQMESHAKPGKLKKIFISHLHGDHIYGLPGLMCSIGQALGNTDKAELAATEKKTLNSSKCSKSAKNSKSSEIVNTSSPSSKKLKTTSEPLQESPDITLYGPVGLRRFVNTALNLSRAFLPYSYSVIELEPTHDQEEAAYNMTAAKADNMDDDECGCGAGSVKKMPTSTLDPKFIQKMNDKRVLGPVPVHPSEILNANDTNTILKYDEVLGGYDLFADSAQTRGFAVPIYHTIPSFGFLIQEPSKPGSIDAKKLRQNGLKPGPLYSKIKSGEVVEFEGNTFRPQDYLSPDKPGNSFVFLGDCNGTDTAVRLINEQSAKNNKRFIVHESTLENKLEGMAIMKGHSTPRMASEFVKNVTKEAKNAVLVLDHFSQRYYDVDDVKRKEGDPCTVDLLREAEEALGCTESLDDKYKVYVAKDQFTLPLR